MKRTLFLSILLISIAGCNSKPYVAETHLKHAVPDAVLPADWQLIQDPRYGFTIGIPPLWKAEDATVLASSTPTGTGQNPVRDLFMSSAKTNQKNDELGFMASCEDANQGFLMMTCTRSPMKENVSLEAEAKDVADKYQENDFLLDGKVTTTKVTLPVGDAYRISYVNAFQGLDFKMSTKVYILVDGKNLYKVSFFCMTTVEDNFKTMPILDTFRVAKVTQS